MIKVNALKISHELTSRGHLSKILLIKVFVLALFAFKALPAQQAPSLTESKSPEYQFNENTILIVTHPFGYIENQTDTAKDLIDKVLSTKGRVVLNYHSQELDDTFKNDLEQKYKSISIDLKEDVSNFTNTKRLILNKTGLGKMGYEEVDNAQELADLGKKIQITEKSNIYLIGNFLECCLSATLAYTLGALHFSHLTHPPAIQIDLDLSNHAATNGLFDQDDNVNLKRYSRPVKLDTQMYIGSPNTGTREGLFDVYIQSYNQKGDCLDDIWTTESALPDYTVKLFYGNWCK